MRVEAVLRVRDDDVRLHVANLPDDLAHRVIARQRVDPAVGPVEPAQLADAQVVARAGQLAGAHLREGLRRGAVVAEDGAGFAARGANEHGADAAVAVVGQRGACADFVVGMGEDARMVGVMLSRDEKLLQSTPPLHPLSLAF